MKAINGNLDMSKRYTLVDVEYSGQATASWESCENCGNTISNIAIVECEDGKKYRIGLDCMDTIVGLLPSEKQQARNIINRKRSFIKMLKTKATSVTVHPQYTKVNDEYVQNPDLGYSFRVYGFKNKIQTEWDVNALGIGIYNDEYKTLIEALGIPITICKK